MTATRRIELDREETARIAEEVATLDTLGYADMRRQLDAATTELRELRAQVAELTALVRRLSEGK